MAMTPRSRSRKAEDLVQAEAVVLEAVEELVPVKWTVKGMETHPEGAFYRRDVVDRLLRRMGWK